MQDKSAGQNGDNLANNSYNQLKQQAFEKPIRRYVVGAMVTDDQQRILTLTRASSEVFHPGLAELPSGRVEQDESLPEALVREVFEETGLVVSSIDAYVNQFVYPSKNGKTTRQWNFSVTTKQGQVVLNPQEHDSYRWLHHEDIVTSKCSKSLQRCMLEYFASLTPR